MAPYILPSAQEGRQREKQTSSSQVAEKLLYLTFSELLHERELLPESSFRTYEFYSRTLSRLDGKASPHAKQTHEILKAASDTLAKRYLRELHLSVHAHPTDNYIAAETYVMRVSYADGDPHLAISSPGRGVPSIRINYRDERALKHQIFQLFGGIKKSISCLKPLRYNHAFSFYVTYMDGVPRSFQPKNFMSVSQMYTPVEMHDDDMEEADVGEAHTKTHACQLRIASSMLALDGGAFELMQMLRESQEQFSPSSGRGSGDGEDMEAGMRGMEITSSHGDKSVESAATTLLRSVDYEGFSSESEEENAMNSTMALGDIEHIVDIERSREPTVDDRASRQQREEDERLAVESALRRRREEAQKKTKDKKAESAHRSRAAPAADRMEGGESFEKSDSSGTPKKFAKARRLARQLPTQPVSDRGSISSGRQMEEIENHGEDDGDATILAEDAGMDTFEGVDMSSVMALSHRLSMDLNVGGRVAESMKRERAEAAPLPSTISTRSARAAGRVARESIRLTAIEESFPMEVKTPKTSVRESALLEVSQNSPGEQPTPAAPEGTARGARKRQKTSMEKEGATAVKKSADKKTGRRSGGKAVEKVVAAPTPRGRRQVKVEETKGGEGSERPVPTRRSTRSMSSRQSHVEEGQGDGDEVDEDPGTRRSSSGTMHATLGDADELESLEGNAAIESEEDSQEKRERERAAMQRTPGVAFTLKKGGDGF